MAKKQEKTVEETIEKPIVDDKVEKIKVKKKPSMKKMNEEDGVVKVDLTKKPEENETKEEITSDNTNDERVVEVVEDTGATQEQEEIQSETETQETPVLEEITGEVEKLEETISDAIVEAEEKGSPLPESIQKLVDFMEETGGDLQDYVKLNQDYSSLENTDLLKEYYKQTKPHLNNEEIDFLMEDLSLIHI